LLEKYQVQLCKFVLCNWRGKKRYNLCKFLFVR